LEEDFGAKDVTAGTLFSATERGTAVFYAKEAGILSGMEIIPAAYHLLDPQIKVKRLKSDGDQVRPSEKIAVVQGAARSILMGERVILNLLQRMSGIATRTKEAVSRLNSKHTRICDTRKTTPGLRAFEKYAVTCGGGFNHRFGLYDGVMIKDNHIAACGSITKAVKKVQEQMGPMVKIEVETETEEQVAEAASAGCDIIMFDNRSPDEIRNLIKVVPKHILTEASGGITMESLPAYGDTGVDYLSLGFLTHSVTSLDISLLWEGE
jgi:nicotinate-nucleotide pyrophosphorylase (carboxylating)